MLHDAPGWAGVPGCDGWCESGAAENRPVRPERSVRPTSWAPPRMTLTVPGVRWAVDALSYDDTIVSAQARHLDGAGAAKDGVQQSHSMVASDPEGPNTLTPDQHAQPGCRPTHAHI